MLEDDTSADTDRSRQPKEKDLLGEQNEHLKHKSSDEKDSGKGNASSDPHLPSHNNKPTGTRAFSTSVGLNATKPPGGYAKAISPEPSNAGYVSEICHRVSSWPWFRGITTTLCTSALSRANVLILADAFSRMSPRRLCLLSSIRHISSLTPLPSALLHWASRRLAKRPFHQPQRTRRTMP